MLVAWANTLHYGTTKHVSICYISITKQSPEVSMQCVINTLRYVGNKHSLRSIIATLVVSSVLPFQLSRTLTPLGSQ